MPKEIVIHATKDQIEDHKGSVLWNDIVTELESWKEGFDLELKTMIGNIAEDNPSTANVLTHMGSLYGRTQAVDYMLNILEMFLQLKEDEQDDT